MIRRWLDRYAPAIIEHAAVWALAAAMTALCYAAWTIGERL